MQIEIDPACVELEILEDFGQIRLVSDSLSRIPVRSLLCTSGRRRSRQVPVCCPGDCRLSADRV